MLILGYAWGRENKFMKGRNHGSLVVINYLLFQEGMDACGNENNGN
jgi:hypothetical protein